KIIDAEAGWYGGLPYREKYLFITLLNDKGRGGLEHRHSCALLAPRFSFKNSEGYEDFLQLVAHEFFHLWNVKRVRPQAFTPYDWSRENHTGLLWAMEGLTRTYEIVALRRAGLVGTQRYLELWAQLITQLRRTPGRFRARLRRGRRTRPAGVARSGAAHHRRARRRRRAGRRRAFRVLAPGRGRRRQGVGRERSRRAPRREQQARVSRRAGPRVLRHALCP